MKVVNSLLERCFQLIELLAGDARAIRLGEIADTLGLQKSATHRLLTALCGMGWVEQIPDTGFYRLTLRLAILGQRILLSTGIPDVTQPVLEKLARDTEELVRMAIVEGERLSWVSYVQGRQGGIMYQPEMIGKVPLHVTANGKAWLATLPPDDAVKIVLEDGFGDPGKFGPNALRTVDALIRTLDDTRSRGWGLAYLEAQPDIVAVAAAICPVGPDTKAVATVSVAGPLGRFTDHNIERLAEMVVAAAKELGNLWPLRPFDKRKGEAA